MPHHAVLYVEWVHRHWGVALAFATVWELIGLVEARKLRP